MARTRARTGQGNGGAPAIEAPPNPLSDQETARQLVGWLKQIEGQKLDITITQRGNGHEDDDPLPVDATVALPPGTTYAERRRQLTEQQERIRTAWPDLMPIVDEMLGG